MMAFLEGNPVVTSFFGQLRMCSGTKCLILKRREKFFVTIVRSRVLSSGRGDSTYVGSLVTVQPWRVSMLLDVRKMIRRMRE